VKPLDSSVLGIRFQVSGQPLTRHLKPGLVAPEGIY